MVVCTICGADLDDQVVESDFSRAGEWLAEDFWRDKGTVCVRCLENRGRLAMMYLHELNR
jgi:hypothetical protein